MSVMTVALIVMSVMTVALIMMSVMRSDTNSGDLNNSSFIIVTLIILAL